MSGVRRNNPKRDQNEPEIVEALRKIGAVVYRLDEPCDLLVLFRGAPHLIEVKMRNGRLTPNEKDAIEKANSVGVPIHIAFTYEDAFRAIGA